MCALLFHRGSRTHRGVDITCNPESTVYAPFSGRIIRASRPYSGTTKPYNNGLYIEGSGAFEGKNCYLAIEISKRECSFKINGNYILRHNT